MCIPGDRTMRDVLILIALPLVIVLGLLGILAAVRRDDV